MEEHKTTGQEQQPKKPGIRELKEQLSQKERAICQKESIIQQKEAVIQDYTDHLKRLQADFENYIKRIEKEKKEFCEFAAQSLIMKLLIIVDDLQRAVAQLKNTGLEQEAVNGVEMILKQLHDILQKEGVQPIKAVGEKLNPYKHEAVLQVEDNNQSDGTIVEELQKGYEMKGRVIRYSKVKITKLEDKKNGKGKDNRN